MRNDTHVAPQIDDEWEKMYWDDGDKELCQVSATSFLFSRFKIIVPNGFYFMKKF